MANPPALAIAEPAGTQALVGCWVDAVREAGAVPDQKLIPRIGAEVKRLLAEGHNAEAITLALRELARRNEPPSRLSYIVGDVERVRAGTPMGRARPPVENPHAAAVNRMVEQLGGRPRVVSG